MQNLTEEKVRLLAMSPLYILFLVTSEYALPEQISERHIVRAVEYGLEDRGPFSEGVFDLLRSHLHEFYAELVSQQGAADQEYLRATLLRLKQLLDSLTGPPEIIDDFKNALKSFAGFVAGGGPFRKKIDHLAMQAQTAWLEELLV